MWEMLLGWLFNTLGSLAGNTASTAIGNSFAQGNAKSAGERTFQQNEMAAQNADTRARQFYTDIQSPEAQLKQLQKAGLSPSLMYSGSGAGGVSASNTGAMGNAGAFMGTPYSMGTPKDIAEIKLLQAQTKLTEQQAENANPDSEMGRATLNQIIAETNNKDANTKLQEMQKDLTQVETELQKGNIKLVDYKCKEAENNARYVFWQAEQSKLNWQFDKQTFEDKVKLIKQDLANKTIEYAIAESNIQLNAEQKSKLIAETEEIYNKLFYYTDIDVSSAEAYQKWIKTQSETLPEQLKVLQGQLELGKTKMWVDFGTSIFNTACHTAGMLMFGKKGGMGGVMQGMQNPVFTPYNTKGASGANAWNAHKNVTWWEN